MPRWFEEGYEPKECNPVEDLKRTFEKEKHKPHNPLFIPADQMEMFEDAAVKARQAGIPIPSLEPCPFLKK